MTVIKQHEGDFRGLKTQFSSLCFIYWGIKEKMESRCSLEIGHLLEDRAPRVVCRKTAGPSSRLLTTMAEKKKAKLRVK